MRRIAMCDGVSLSATRTRLYEAIVNIYVYYKGVEQLRDVLLACNQK